MTRIQVRRGSSGEWSALNPVLSVGEPGYTSDDGVLKIGNGTDPWTALDGIASGSVTEPGGYTTDAGDITTGVFAPARIPNLDAGKITTGTINVSRIPSLDASQIGSGTFEPAVIPNLDTSKVTTGAFDLARIPALPATAVTTGTFAAARIPALDASQITTGVLDPARIPGSTGGGGGAVTDASQIVSGVFGTARIPNLDASRISTGTFSTNRIPALPYVSTSDVSVFPTSRIPNLDAAKITTGVLATARIPALPYVLDSDASVFPANRIPTLDASKITTGVLDTARIPAVASVLDPQRNWVNMITNPDFNQGLAPHAAAGNVVATLIGSAPMGIATHTGQQALNIVMPVPVGDVFYPMDGSEKFPRPVMGATYEFSLWIRSGTTSYAPSAMNAGIIVRSDTIVTQTGYSGTPGYIGGDWIKMTARCTITDPTAINMYLILTASGTNGQNDSVIIDDMMFRQVFEAAPVTPTGPDPALAARVASLEQTAATVEEIVVSVTQEGRWSGTPNVFTNNVSGAGATYSQSIFTAPYACRVVSFDIIREFGDTPLHASDYITSQLLNGANAISTKRTVSGTGQAMNSGIPWMHDPATFNPTYALMAKGQRLQAAWTIFGSASMRFPCNYTFRIVPV